MRRPKIDHIYDDGQVRIRAISGSSDRLVVVYLSAMPGGGLRDLNTVATVSPNGEKDYLLFVADRDRNWFSTRDTSKIIKRQIEKYSKLNGLSRLFSFGSSMGGYGALLNSDNSFETVVAVNPQISMHPDVVGVRAGHRVRKSWKEISAPTGPNLPKSVADGLVGLDTNLIIVFGDVEYLDRYQRNLLPKAMNLHVFQVRGADHGLWNDICTAGLSRSFLEASFIGDFDEVNCILKKVEYLISSGEIDRARGHSHHKILSIQRRRRLRKIKSRVLETFYRIF